MAYTIISQNNTTTTLADENGNVITVPARVTLATSTDYTITKVNNNSVDLVDGNGKVIRGVPACVVLAGGGGGSDQHNLGYYATQAALEEAHPTAEAGDWAIVGATDTVWVWDTDNSEWVDTDTKGEVTPDMVIIKSATMPTPSTTPVGAIYQYTGATNSTYTHDYIYENVATTTSSSASAEQTVGSTLSDIAVDLATLESFTGWTTDNSLQIFYTADGWSVDTTSLGVTYTGTPNVGDAITITYTAESTTYAWTRIDVQPAPEALPDQTGQSGKFLTTDGTDASWGTVESLPSQTGQSGKFLTTDGTDASWSDKPLVNTATGSNSLTILGTANANQDGINIGVGSVSARGSVVIGNGASANRNTLCIGDNAKALGSYGTAVGGSARTNIAIGYEIALGLGAQTNAKQAIQIGCINGTSTTNSDANTFKVANANGNFEIMSADGTVPTARLTKVNTTATLAVADWSSSTQTISVNGVTSTSVVFVAPDPSDAADYAAAGILCTSQGTNSLTFTATTTPTNDIDVNIVCL